MDQKAEHKRIGRPPAPNKQPTEARRQKMRDTARQQRADAKAYRDLQKSPIFGVEDAIMAIMMGSGALYSREGIIIKLFGEFMDAESRAKVESTAPEPIVIAGYVPPPSDKI